MTRDVVRTACIIVAMAVAASLVIEVRWQLACIDTAHHRTVTAMPGAMVAAHPLPPQQAAAGPGRLRMLGRAAVEFADAALGVVR
jgi:hypothetical protein